MGLHSHTRIIAHIATKYCDKYFKQKYDNSITRAPMTYGTKLLTTAQY